MKKIIDLFTWKRKAKATLENGSNNEHEATVENVSPGVNKDATEKELQKLTTADMRTVIAGGIRSYFEEQALHEKEKERARRNSRWKFFGALVALAIFLFALLGGDGDNKVPIAEKRIQKPVPGVVGGTGSGKVAIIKLEGAISGDYLGDASSENTVRYLQDALELAGGEGDKLAGIVLYINSPGGGSAASAQLCRTLKKFRATHKEVLVIAYVSQGAYSGGYYAAVCADRIIVDPEANVANIGVIMRLFNTAGIGKMLGITENEVSTGPRKNTGSQWRELSPEDRVMLERSIGAAFEGFLKAVSESRKIPLETLREESKQAQGRTSGAWFSPEDALKGKLIDEIIPVEDFFGIYGPKFAAAKKFREIEYVQLEKKVGVAELVTKKTEQIFRGALRGVMEESLRQEKQIRAE